MIHHLEITTYKVPIKIDEEGNVVETDLDYKDDMVIENEPITWDSEIDNIQLKIPELSKKLAAWNKSQLVVCKTLNKDYIKKKVLKKSQEEKK